MLLLVGKGELENDIKNKIEKLNLKDKVIFTGVRSDVPDIMMAMDIFVFPSCFEGMPNAVIESQATGLHCLIADSITKEVQITDLVCYKSLNTAPEEWAEAALENFGVAHRNDVAGCFKNKGYDMRVLVKEFENIIFTR